MSSIKSLALASFVLAILISHLVVQCEQFGSFKRHKKLDRAERNVRRAIKKLNLERTVSPKSRLIECGEPILEDSGQLVSRHPGVQTRIHNGNDAKPGQLAFQARIQWSGQNCSGVIIDEQSILTSAQCVFDLKRGEIVSPEKISVFVGDYYAPYEDGEIRLTVKKVRVHIEMLKRLEREGITNDLAILTTNEKMTWRLTRVGFGSVNRICLPDSDVEYPDQMHLYVSGWGGTEQGLAQSEALKIAQIELADQLGCKLVWSHRQQSVDNGHICSSTLSGRGAFEGDLGAPLFRYRSDTKRAELVGLASVFLPPNEKLGPNINTRVSHFIGWIKGGTN